DPIMLFSRARNRGLSCASNSVRRRVSRFNASRQCRSSSAAEGISPAWLSPCPPWSNRKRASIMLVCIRSGLQIRLRLHAETGWRFEGSFAELFHQIDVFAHFVFVGAKNPRRLFGN